MNHGLDTRQRFEQGSSFVQLARHKLRVIPGGREGTVQSVAGILAELEGGQGSHGIVRLTVQLDRIILRTGLCLGWIQCGESNSPARLSDGDRAIIEEPLEVLPSIQARTEHS